MRIKYAYRMTHVANIPDILRVGIVKASSANANDHYVPIGDASAIVTRQQKALSDGSLIGNYIPFYFGPRTPMLYVIQHGYNMVQRQKPEDIVYCVLSLEDVIRDNIDCVFTDGHALNKITKVYPGRLLSEIDKYVSYDMVYAQSWFDAPDVKRKKEAELLLMNDLPPHYIKYFLVYNDSVRQHLHSLGIEETRIKVVPHFYF